jgi:hypothetical protein
MPLGGVVSRFISPIEALCSLAKAQWKGNDQLGNFCLALFLTAFFGFFPAKLPNNASPTKFAVDARIGAGPAFVQAFLTIIIIHFLTMDARFPVGVKTAKHRKSFR